MTDTQVAYWNMREAVTHNRNVESENYRHNLQTESVERGKMEEAARHNKSVEGESKRHNLITESQEGQRLVISGRQAAASENQAKASLIQAKAARKNANTNRKALGISALSAQAQLASASAASIGASASMLQAQTAAETAKYQRDKLAADTGLTNQKAITESGKSESAVAQGFIDRETIGARVKAASLANTKTKTDVFRNIASGIGSGIGVIGSLVKAVK